MFRFGVDLDAVAARLAQLRLLLAQNASPGRFVRFSSDFESAPTSDFLASERAAYLNRASCSSVDWMPGIGSACL